MPAPLLDTLANVEDAVWRELHAAPHDRSHPWRTAVLATTDGRVGDGRSVVLREADRDAQRLLIYTDARSPKVEQVRTHAEGTLVVWSPALEWQLRIRVRLAVITDGLELSSRWAQLKLTPSAHDYLSSLPPGSALDSALGARGERAHFALLSAQVLQIDWLELRSQGRRRAVFGADATPSWLQP